MNTLIAIPTFNCGDYLEETVYSALNQTVKSQILIIDNCSTDNTTNFLADIESENYDNVKILKNKYNKGRTGNWNECLNEFKKSTCNYIKFLFPGDLIDKNCIEECEKIFHKYENIGAIAFPYRFIDVNNNIFISRHKKYSNQLIEKDELLKINLSKGGVLGAIISNVYSKTAIGKNFFDEYQISKTKFDIRVLENHSVFYLNKVLATFQSKYHNTFDKADSTLVNIEFSNIEFGELYRIYSMNRINTKMFTKINQEIILSTFKRMLRFSNNRNLVVLIFLIPFFFVFNTLRVFKNNLIVVKLKKLIYR